MVQTIKRKMTSRAGKIACATGGVLVVCALLAWSLSPMEKASAGPDIAANKITVSVETEFLAGSLWKIAGTPVTSTAAELNYLDVTAGTGTASKALVLDSSGDLTWPNNGDLTSATAGGNDLGSTSAEWGNIYISDSKGLYLGADQDGSLLHAGTTVTLSATTLNVASTNKMSFRIGTGEELHLDDAAIASTASGDTAGDTAYLGTTLGGSDEAENGGNAGGALNITTGAGSAGGAAQVGGVGGALSVTSGPGGVPDSGSANGGDGGALAVAAGAAGAAGAGGGTGGDGGDLTITAGQAGGAGGGSAGTGGTLAIDAGAANGGTSGAVTIGTTNGESVAIGRSGKDVTIGGVVKTTVGNGTIVTDKCTTVEGGDGVLHQTIVTFTLTGAHDLDMADDDHGTGIKVYDFPAGSIQILGATCNAIATSVNTGAGGGTYPMALGSAVGADDNTLTSTEADIIPSTAITGGTGSTASDFHATLAAPILFVNAGGADLDLYCNAAITAAVAEGAVTIAVTGTATITWINMGDY